jgi:hypothetical protein
MLVFNGPVGAPFNQRASDWLGQNEAVFAEKHHLCVARFDHVVEWCDLTENDEARRLLFWKTINETGGPLLPPHKGNP